MTNKLLKFKGFITNSERGFTLVEVLMYISIFSMLIVILFQLLVSILDVQLESQGNSGIDQDGLYILNRIAYDLSKADTISSPSAGFSSEILEFIVNGSTLSYTNATSSLLLTDVSQGTTDSINSANSEISNLIFTRKSDIQGRGLNTVTVEFTITSKTITRGTRDTKDFRTTIGLRQP